ncbi:hypothetical protein N7539_002293 [Penicillium diatomitis]|uniref:Glucosamine 6-phosphate N-acetyltransferase n=1 Tax=Penicillium diatomitis TaxID=2819901 RepID=A0A9W9XEN5_9EURO|nr:uncharacterized protein N7539_002293 [Penicillium diatomitis]KAJ5490726.1 hypothetical protein N7539_002293 [Penicillium diatomitis]
MALTQPSSPYVFTTAIQPPPGPSARLVIPSEFLQRTETPDPSLQSASAITNSSSNENPPVFNDAMKVRARVFIHEQHCSVEGEIDEDDPRSWQWVIYATEAPSTTHSPSPLASGTPQPVAVIRLVPPPHLPHEALFHDDAVQDFSNDHGLSSQPLPSYDWTHEPCIKITRVAVLPEFRGLGLGRKLLDVALDWASTHAEEIDNAARQLAIRVGVGSGAGRESQHESTGSDSQSPAASMGHRGAEQRRDEKVSTAPWRGLVLVHAQVDVEAMYRGMGFTQDKALGMWDEEGIQHVGMFRRVDVQSRG